MRSKKEDFAKANRAMTARAKLAAIAGVGSVDHPIVFARCAREWCAIKELIEEVDKTENTREVLDQLIWLQDKVMDIVGALVNELALEAR